MSFSLYHTLTRSIGKLVQSDTIYFMSTIHNTRFKLNILRAFLIQINFVSVKLVPPYNLRSEFYFQRINAPDKS